MIIGVDSQPVSSFQKWKDRGINTLVRAESEGGIVSMAKWEEAAMKLGLNFITLPDMKDSGHFKSQCQQPGRLAFSQDDEPDLTRNHILDPVTLQTTGKFQGWKRPEILKALYDYCKSGNSALPIFVNFDGTHVTAFSDGTGHAGYVASADWLSHDWYPFNRNASRYTEALMDQAMKNLSKWGAGKPQLAYVECGRIGMGNALGRSPTADEMEREIMTVVGNGGIGWVYFPQQIDSFKFDNVSADCLARMVSVNAKYGSVGYQVSGSVGGSVGTDDNGERVTALGKLAYKVATAMSEFSAKLADALKERYGG